MSDDLGKRPSMGGMQLIRVGHMILNYDGIKRHLTEIKQDREQAAARLAKDGVDRSAASWQAIADQAGVCLETVTALQDQLKTLRGMIMSAGAS